MKRLTVGRQAQEGYAIYRMYENGAYELAHLEYGDSAVVTDETGLYPAATWERAVLLASTLPRAKG